MQVKKEKCETMVTDLSILPYFYKQLNRSNAKQGRIATINMSKSHFTNNLTSLAPNMFACLGTSPIRQKQIELQKPCSRSYYYELQVLAST